MPLHLPDLKNKRTQLALGGAGAVVAFALYRRSHAKSSSSSSAPSSTLSDPLASAAFGTAAIENDVYGALEPQIAALAAQIQHLHPGPTPVPKPKPPTQPGKQGGPVKPPNFGKIDANLFPKAFAYNALPAGDLTTLGVISGAGGMFTGHNVAGGAPVYAELGPYGVAVQGFDAKELPVGTKLVTPSIFSSLLSPNTVQERL